MFFKNVDKPDSSKDVCNVREEEENELSLFANKNMDQNRYGT